MSNIVKDMIVKEDITVDDTIKINQDDQLKQKVNQLNSDPTISIISKFVNSDEELYNLYNKYSLLPKKFKRLSNQYSMQLFGYNVPNMYAIMRDKLIDNDYIFGDDKVIGTIGKDVMESINLSVLNNDKSLLESIDVSELDIKEKAMVDYEFNEAKKEIL